MTAERALEIAVLARNNAAATYAAERAATGAKVARYAREGLTDPQIGALLGLSSSQTRNYRSTHGVPPGSRRAFDFAVAS